MPKLMYNGEEIIGGGSSSAGVSSFNGRAVYAAAKAEQYSIPSCAVTASADSAEIQRKEVEE